MIAVALMLVGFYLTISGMIVGLTYPFPDTSNKVWGGIFVMACGALAGIIDMIKGKIK